MKSAKRIIAVLTAVIVLSLSVILLFSEKKTFLESENRVPSSMPEFTINSITDGKFTTALEEYLKDHFPFRDSFMKLKTNVQTDIGYKKISGVFITDKRLFQEVENPDIKRLTESANLLFSSINNNDIVTSVMVIPTASEVYSDELPTHCSVIAQSPIIDQILNEIDCDFRFNPTKLLTQSKATNDMFYVSDHHWTSHAALLAYNDICNALGVPHSPTGSFSAETVSESFRGTLHSKIPVDSIKDTIIRYEYPGCSFKTHAAKGAKSELYETEYFADEYLLKKDKYSYFGNGNLPLLILENENSLSESEIVIIKDSFANCMIPHFTENFRKVHVIDPRYFKGKRISEYVNEIPEISHVLIVYGINSLNDNSGVSTLS